MEVPASRDDRVAALPARLQELLDKQLAGQAAESGDGDRGDGIAPVAGTDGLPMSLAQQRLWFLDEFEPDSVEYHSSCGLRLSGELDLAALTAALRGLVGRHESLRTTFESVDGRGVQVVHPPFELPVTVLDMCQERLRRRPASTDLPIELQVLRASALKTPEVQEGANGSQCGFQRGPPAALPWTRASCPSQRRDRPVSQVLDERDEAVEVQLLPRDATHRRPTEQKR